uniref:Uncharacterized protein n=1 Tax=Mizugakiibacter sediminis TaxID=1475481 RepID=A0A0U1PBB2_9GAMM
MHVQPRIAPLAAALALVLAPALSAFAAVETSPFAHPAARNLGRAAAGGRVAAMQPSLKTFERSFDGDEDAAAKARYAAAPKQAKALDDELGKLKDNVYAPTARHDVLEDDLHQPTDLHAAVSALAGGLASFGTQTPMQTLQQASDGKVAAALDRFNALPAGDVARYNQAAYAAGAPTLMTGAPIAVKTAAP